MSCSAAIAFAKFSVRLVREKICSNVSAFVVVIGRNPAGTVLPCAPPEGLPLHSGRAHHPFFSLRTLLHTPAKYHTRQLWVLCSHELEAVSTERRVRSNNYHHRGSGSSETRVESRSSRCKRRPTVTPHTWLCTPTTPMVTQVS